jgi:hypothetical protein
VRDLKCAQGGGAGGGGGLAVWLAAPAVGSQVVHPLLYSSSRRCKYNRCQCQHSFTARSSCLRMCEADHLSVGVCSEAGVECVVVAPGCAQN